MDSIFSKLLLRIIFKASRKLAYPAADLQCELKVISAARFTTSSFELSTFYSYYFASSIVPSRLSLAINLQISRYQETKVILRTYLKDWILQALQKFLRSKYMQNRVGGTVPNDLETVLEIQYQTKS